MKLPVMCQVYFRCSPCPFCSPPPTASPQQVQASCRGGWGCRAIAALLFLCGYTQSFLQVFIQDIQIQPPSSGSSQAEVVAIATALGAPQGGGPSLRKGDKHSCVVQVQAGAAGQDLHLGHVVITWARAAG